MLNISKNGIVSFNPGYTRRTVEMSRGSNNDETEQVVYLILSVLLTYASISQIHEEEFKIF